MAYEQHTWLIGEPLLFKFFQDGFPIVRGFHQSPREMRSSYGSRKKAREMEGALFPFSIKNISHTDKRRTFGTLFIFKG